MGTYYALYTSSEAGSDIGIQSEYLQVPTQCLTLPTAAVIRICVAWFSLTEEHSCPLAEIIIPIGSGV